MKTKFEELLDNMSNNIHYTKSLPLDGSLYSMSEYLDNVARENNNDFYRRYLNHLQYFLGIYDLKGGKEFNRIAQPLLRHCIEFGKVGLTKLNGKLLPIAISKLEYNMYGEIVKCEGLPLRLGYGYTQNLTTIKCDPKNVVVLKQNYLALPMLYFWRKPIETIIHLAQSAITGSISSIKKFKRNQQNNSSTISKIEEMSFLDPRTPYITVIANPTGYAGINKRTNNSLEEINRDKYDIDQTTAPSSVDFSTINPDTSYLWSNLKEYMEFEYYQLNRRLNTNKKKERNIAAEVQTETINFDLLDQEFKRYLLLFVEECKEILDEEIELIDFIADSLTVEKETYDNNIIERDIYENSSKVPETK